MYTQEQKDTLNQPYYADPQISLSVKLEALRDRAKAIQQQQESL